MDETQVRELMESSTSEAEWNANCGKVKKACGGYPPFWYSVVVLSKLAKKVSARWGGTDEIGIAAF